MANIKSAKKRILVNQTKYERNKAAKSAVVQRVSTTRTTLLERFQD